MSSYIGGGNMKNPKEILTLLGIPAEKVEQFDFIEGINEPSKIMLTLLNNRTVCPHCGSSDVVVHGYYKANINNSIIRANKLYVEVNIRRYKCKKCKKTFKTNYSFYEKNKHISRAVDIALKEGLKHMITYTELAKQCDVSTNYVIKLFDTLPQQKRLPLPSVICVDEFHFSNARNKRCKFPFVMSNPFTGEIIEIIESRTRDYLWSYFIRLSIQERSKVKYFVSDMNETYRSLKKAFFLIAFTSLIIFISLNCFLLLYKK